MSDIIDWDKFIDSLPVNEGIKLYEKLKQKLKDLVGDFPKTVDDFHYELDEYDRKINNEKVKDMSEEMDGFKNGIPVEEAIEFLHDWNNTLKEKQLEQQADEQRQDDLKKQLEQAEEELRVEQEKNGIDLTEFNKEDTQFFRDQILRKLHNAGFTSGESIPSGELVSKISQDGEVLTPMGKGKRDFSHGYTNAFVDMIRKYGIDVANEHIDEYHSLVNKFIKLSKNIESEGFKSEKTDYNSVKLILVLIQFILDNACWEPLFTVPGSLEKFIEVKGSLISAQKRAEKAIKFIENGRKKNEDPEEEWTEISEEDREPTATEGEQELSEIEKQANPEGKCG